MHSCTADRRLRMPAICELASFELGHVRSLLTYRRLTPVKEAFACACACDHWKERRIGAVGVHCCSLLFYAVFAVCLSVCLLSLWRV
jgi:hypothetical protein